MSRLTNDFSTASMNAVGEWKNIYKMPRKNNCQFRIANPAKLFSKSEGKIDIFRHTKASVFSTSTSSLKEFLKDIILGRRKVISGEILG